MALNFPNNPSIGQIYSSDGVSWEWDGTVWNVLLPFSGSAFPFSGSAYITGSLQVVGPVTGSFFTGDGSGITGIVSASYAVTASYALNGGGGGQVDLQQIILYTQYFS